MNEYDRLLAAMPSSIAGGAVVDWMGAIPISDGALAGCLLAGALVLVSLFVVPPDP